MSEYVDAGICPKCKDCHTFTRQESGYRDYQWDENVGTYVAVEVENDCNPLTCSACGAVVDEEASKKAGRIILLAGTEPELDPQKVNIEILFTAEMVQEYIKDTFDFEPTIEAIKAFFDDKDTWIVNYLHEAGWDLITNNAYEHFQNTAVFKCKECEAESKYTK